MERHSPPKEFFNGDNLRTDLEARSVRGGAVTIAAQAVTFALGFLSTIVLARLLTPRDFGLIAMVTAVTGFVMLFKDLGLSMATVQKEDITHAQVSSLFWINLALSIVTVVITAVLAPVIAWFYKDVRLIWITLALSSAFVLGGLTVQHEALLRRRMRFSVLASIQIVSTSLSVLAAIVAARYGAGYWALVVKQVVGALAGMIGVWVMCRWLPGLPTRNSGVAKLVAFGWNLTSFNVLNYLSRNADNVLIGKFVGSVQLGLYSKAYELMMLPIRQITVPISAVAIPALSRLQDDPERYRRYYYRAMNAIAFATMPLITMIAAFSKETIEILLGPQWAGAVPIFKILAFVALLQPVVNPVGWVFVSLGHTRQQLRWAIVSVPFTLISFAIGLPWGAIGVAVSYMICNFTVLTLPALWWAFRDSPLCILGWVRSIQCPLSGSLLLYGAVELTRWWLSAATQMVAVPISAAAGVAAFAIVIGAWRRARRELLATIGVLKVLSARTGKKNEDRAQLDGSSRKRFRDSR